MKKMYEADYGKWPCKPQSALLRYLIRVKPEEGATAVRDSLAARSMTACYDSLLTDLGDSMSSPGVEKVAMDALNDANLDVAQDAALALAKHGSKDSEARLWARLEQLYETRKGRRDDSGGVVHPATSASLEVHLVQGLLTASAWFASDAMIEKLRTLVTSAEAQQTIDAQARLRQSAPLSLDLNWAWHQFSWDVAGYHGDTLASLREKLAQLPAGTSLETILTQEDETEHATEIQVVRDAATRDGLILTIVHPD